MADFKYDPEDRLHQQALALAILAELAEEDLVEYAGECILTNEAEARLLQVMVQAGCSREEIGAAMRLEPGRKVS